MKRLLCIISCMNTGGAETFLMKLYRTMDRTKYQMDFAITAKEKCFYEDEILSLGGKIFRISAKTENVKTFKSQLESVVQQGCYNYVLKITSNTMGFWDLCISKKAGAQHCCVRSSNSSDGASLKTKIMHRLGRLLYAQYIDVKIAPSDLAAMYTFGKRVYDKGEVNILHNAVDLAVFNYNENARKKIRSEFGISESATLIGHIGRFMTQKNHKFLLSIFSEIYKRNRTAHLLLVGTGTLEEQIHEQAQELGLSDNVIFAGVRNDIPDILSAMDVFVFPSLYEGMPNTVIEAQATGLPCVISDSITKEADITGIVEYMPLISSAEEWAIKALNVVSPIRKNTYDDFIKNKYDIESITRDFISLVFNE